MVRLDITNAENGEVWLSISLLRILSAFYNIEPESLSKKQQNVVLGNKYLFHRHPLNNVILN